MNTKLGSNAELESSAWVRARVVAEHRGVYEVAGVPGVVHGVLRGAMATADDPRERPAVGDWVRLSPQAGNEVAPIEAIEARTSLFVRRAVGKRAQVQVVAANVDTVLVVMGVDGDFNPRRLERYRVSVADAGAQAVVVLNKCDLDPTGTRGAELPGPVVRISAAQDQGLEALAPWLAPGQTVAVVGSSGVGKSTLVNCLLGREDQATGATRAGDGRGRHTTTGRMLRTLPGGAALIDTPGMRELGLVGEGEGLAEVFTEVEALMTVCRFRNCGHQEEPGCAVAAAIEAGTLTAARWASYLKLRREATAEARRRDEALRAIDQRVWQQRTVQNQRRTQTRDRLGWKA